jgi:hypothetical protein
MHLPSFEQKSSLKVKVILTSKFNKMSFKQYRAWPDCSDTPAGKIYTVTEANASCDIISV